METKQVQQETVGLAPWRNSASQVTQDNLVITLPEVIDSGLSFSQKSVPKGIQSITVDCGRVTRISAAGIRAWIWYFGGLRRTVRSIHFIRFSPILVDAAMIVSFVGRGEVESVLLPYRCAACCVQSYLWAKLSVIGASGSMPLGLSCPSCGDAAMFDDHTTHYEVFAAAYGLPRTEAA
jgi:hypothetical protein